MASVRKTLQKGQTECPRLPRPSLSLSLSLTYEKGKVGRRLFTILLFACKKTVLYLLYDHSVVDTKKQNKLDADKDGIHRIRYHDPRSTLFFCLFVQTSFIIRHVLP